MSAPNLDVELHSLRPCDAEEVAQVWFDSWQSTGLADGSTLARLVQRIASHSWQVIVAHVESEIVGFVAYEPEHRWLRQIFVKPTRKRSKIGTALLGAAKRAMPGGFWLRTPVENMSARAFYERSGMRLSGEEHHPKTGEAVARYTWMDWENADGP